ncbi:MAG: hypothetical protein IT167_29575 [Bryobacterales bacterium]|nr:hypothetical protein [Bryobacterales bacterium]
MFEGEGFPELLGGPFGGGMGCHVEVNAATIMGEHEEYVEDLKPERWQGEEVNGDKALGVVFEDRAPFFDCGLGGRTMYLLTLDSPISIPSFINSPWTRGAPRSGFSRLILRIRSRTSF